MKKVKFIIAAITLPMVLAMCTSKEDTKNINETEAVTSLDVKKDNNPEKEHNCMKHVDAEEQLKYRSKTLTVKGDVENKLVLTVDSLRKMLAVTINDFNVVCETGATMKVNKTSTGVLLKDILKKANIVQENHKDRNFYIVARATDGYKATFSWAEIFNNATGDSVYVLYEENNAPIEKQGDMILVCTNDIKTGPRHVFWLEGIEVTRIN